MSSYRVALAAMLLVAGVGCGAADDNASDGNDTAAPTESTDSAEPAADSDDEYVAPDIDGTYKSSCDNLVGEMDAWYRLVADARIKNTGNVGTVNRVTAIWFQAGGARIIERKTARLEPGQSKRVGFDRESNSEEFDRIMTLAMDDMKTCDVKVAVTDTFGEPQDD